MVDENYKDLKKVLKEALPLIPPEVEKTFFSIGGRGYYENPISDVLAFFLDPQEVHGFHLLFLDSLFTALNLSTPPPSSLDLVCPPLREVSTDSGKRIDIVLEGDDWVLAIENKIYHHQNNPFSDYEKHIKNNYADKKHIIFVVLSPKGTSEKWEALSYKSLISEIKKNLGGVMLETQYNKWFVFLRDFIINLEQYAVRYEMKQNTLDFIEANYQETTQISKLREKYIKHIQRLAKEKLEQTYEGQLFTTTIHNWHNGPALRFYSDLWVKKSNIVIQIGEGTEKGFGIYMYAYGVDPEDIKSTDTELKISDYHKEPWIEQNTIRCYKPKQDERTTKYDDTLQKRLIECAKKLNNYSRKKKLPIE